MSGNLSDDSMKAVLKFLYERRLAMVSFRAEVSVIEHIASKSKGGEFCVSPRDNSRIT